MELFLKFNQFLAQAEVPTKESLLIQSLLPGFFGGVIFGAMLKGEQTGLKPVFKWIALLCPIIGAILGLPAFLKMQDSLYVTAYAAGMGRMWILLHYTAFWFNVAAIFGLIIWGKFASRHSQHQY